VTALAGAVIATVAVILAPFLVTEEGSVKKLAAHAAEIAPMTAVSAHSPANPAIGELGRMTVTGRVLGPDGKPAAGVPVDVIGRPREPWAATSPNVDRRVLIGHGETDVDGRFRVDAARTASARFFEVDVVATMRGHGLGMARLNPDADQPAAEISLRPEQVIHGRVVDVTGQPVAGLRICVGRIGRFNGATFDGVNLSESVPLEGLRTWPPPAETDDRGQFELGGIGRNSPVGLVVQDPRFAHQWLFCETDDQKGPKKVTLVLQPANIIDGRVLADDTGQPIPGATIAIAASGDELGSMYITRFRADSVGRFVANPSPGSYFRLTAAPPEGQAYLVTEIAFAWTKGNVRRLVDARLPKGVLIRGKVREERTGRPLSGASVQFIPARRTDGVADRWQSIVASSDDGSFQIAVPPGKGHLFVFGPTPDYALETVGSRMLHLGQPGGERRYAHKIVPYDVRSGERPEAVAAKLRLGQTVKGRLVGPEGQTVEKAEIIATLHFNHFRVHWRGDITIPARDGRFELHGLDPAKTTRVSFLDADHEWGLTVELCGKQAEGDLTIRLQSCGQAKARFVGPDGKSVAGIVPFLEIVATPGPQFDTRNPEQEAMLAADAVAVAAIDRKHYLNGPRTDSDGRITLPDLIPGGLYRISDHSDRDRQGIVVRKDFSVVAGETVDLGDVLIKNPSD